MPTFAVQYTYDHRDAGRAAHRPAHRAHLRALAERGLLLASGPYTGSTVGTTAPEPAGALLLLRGASLDEVLEALDADPFWLEGLVVARTARPWDPVIGPWAD